MSSAIGPEEARPPRLWLRLGIAIGAFTLVVLLAGFLLNACLPSRIKQIEAEMDATDPGWRLDEILAARPDPPAGQNSADVIAFVDAQVPGNLRYPGLSDATDRVRAPYRLNTAVRGVLDARFQTIDAAVQAARTIATMPTGRYPLVLEDNPFTSNLVREDCALDVASLLRYDAVRLADRGDLDGAMRSCRAAVHCGQSFASGDLISLIRVLCVDIGMDTIEYVLSQGELPSSACAEMQALLLAEEQFNDLLMDLRGRRAMTHDLLGKVMNGRLPMREVFDLGLGQRVPSNWWYRLFGYTAADVRREYPVFMDAINRRIEAARLPLPERTVALDALDAERSDLARRYPLVATFLPITVGMRQQYYAKLAQVGAMRVLLGVERYRLAHKRWPARLEDIPADLLPGGLPRDPFDGLPLRYRRTTDGVVVYSVGNDRTDDGGVVVNEDGRRDLQRELAPDRGYRLWDVAKRRQPPPPPPPAEPSP